MQLSHDQYLQGLLSPLSYGTAEKRPQRTVVFRRHIDQRPPVRAGPQYIFIFRGLGTLNSSNGFPKIFEGSHKMSNAKVVELMASGQLTATDITLQPDQAIIMDGNLVIEYPMAGDGIAFLESIYKPR
jgi:hypothetical protein